VWLGSKSGVVVSWSDTQVVVTVASGSTTGTAQILQGGVRSNAEPFTIVIQTSLRVVPEKMNMLVGETRTLQVFDSQTGSSVTNVTWTISDPSVAEISTDNPPVLTAKAAGHATITAGEASADLTVYEGFALPDGTVRWSAPGDGSGLVKMALAVPSPDTVADVFALQSSGLVQALRLDGSLVWTSRFPDSVSDVKPDASGGLLGITDTSVSRLDPATGQQSWQHQLSGNIDSSLAVHPEGTIFILEHSNEDPYVSVVGLDGATGAALPPFSVPIIM
jgi:outer membrane protein assembly factor BamB